MNFIVSKEIRLQSYRAPFHFIFDKNTKLLHTKNDFQYNITGLSNAMQTYKAGGFKAYYFINHALNLY